MLLHQRIVGLLMVVVTASWGPTAYAQGGQRFGMMGQDFCSVAANKVVQKEIGIDSAAASKVQSIVDEYREHLSTAINSAGDSAQAINKLQDLSQEEREKRLRQISDKHAVATKTLYEKGVAQFKAALSAPQFERLQQIAWQAGGSEAMASDPDLAKALDLTNDQVEKITGINVEYRNKQREIFGQARGQGGRPISEARAKQQELDRDRDGKAIELLTNDQRDRFTKLKGKAFDLTLLK